MGKDTKSDSGLPPEVEANKTHLVKGATMNMLIKALRRTKPIGGRGVQVRQTDDGWVIDAEALDEGPAPWEIIGTGEDAVIRKGLLFDGLTEHVPLVDASPMEELSPLDVSSGNVWLYLQWEPVVDDGVVLAGGEASDVAIVTSAGSGSYPTPTSNGDLYIHLWENGVSYWSTSIRVTFCPGPGYIVAPYGS